MVLNPSLSILASAIFCAMIMNASPRLTEDDPLPIGWPDPPELTVPQSVCVGSLLEGEVEDHNPPITVVCYLNGVEVDRQTITSQSGDFSLGIGEASHGDTVEVVAEDSFGNLTSDDSDVEDC